MWKQMTAASIPCPSLSRIKTCCFYGKVLKLGHQLEEGIMEPQVLQHEEENNFQSSANT